MKVSIIVPVYNVEEYIAQCLESLVNQTYNNIEIICVNDGSTDNSLGVLEKYKQHHPEIIKIVNKKNGGLADARNFGLDNATGDYVAFVDSDDWIHPSMCENMLKKAMEKNADVVVCDYTEVYNDRQVIINDNNDNYKLLYETLVCNKFFRRSLFENNDVRFPIGLWYEDNATTYKLLYLANRVEKEDNSYYFYRRTRENSIMNSQKSSKIYDMYKIGDELHKFFSSYSLDSQAAQQVEYIFIKNVLFRQIPKIVKYEFPNILKMKRKLKEHFEYIEGYYPQWYKNSIFVEDKNKYFYNKIGKNHINKLISFKSSLIKLVVTVIFNK